VPTDREGLLIIRAYVEEQSASPLRAHIRLTTDVSAGFERTVTLAEAAAVGTLVQAWLRELLADP
jgi:cystathionine beta-lyase family protein involved in aluminum resistance